MSGVWLDFLGILLLGANMSVVFFMVYFEYEKRQAAKEKKRHLDGLQAAVQEGADKFPDDAPGVELTSVDSAPKDEFTPST